MYVEEEQEIAIICLQLGGVIEPTLSAVWVDLVSMEGSAMSESDRSITHSQTGTKWSKN